MPKAKCPSCATVVTFVAGYDPVCPQCGFRGAAPAVLQPAPAAWAPVSGSPNQQVYAQPTHAQPTYTHQVHSPSTPVTQPGYAVLGKQQGMAVAALICGIAAIFVPPAGLAAIILGAAAMSNADRDPQRFGGKGMAVAGLVLGILFFLFWISMWGSMSMWDGDWMWGW